MNESIEALRERLSAREKSLKSLRKQVVTAKQEASKPAASSSISDIQRRYMAAVAGLDAKSEESTKPVVRTGSDVVASLANRWNSGGIQGVQVEKTPVDVRGDVRSARKSFGAADAPKVGDFGRGVGREGGKKKKTIEDYGPAELEVEDEDVGLPSWAVNQKKKTIKKENARNSVRDVDVKDLQGSVLEQGAKDGSDSAGEKVQVGGNVKAALAMWGKTAEEDTMLLQRRKEEEERQKALELKLKKEREEKEKKRKMEEAVRKFARMELNELPREEPKDETELAAYLERRIALVEKDIKVAEKELAEWEGKALNQ